MPATETKKRGRNIYAPTLRQKRVIELTKQELLRTNGIQTSKAKIIRKAGYKESLALAPQRVYDRPPVKKALSDFISSLEEKRQMAVDAITNAKLQKGNARDAAYVADVMTKNHQLLTGGATERHSLEMDDSSYRRILDRERARIVSVQDGKGNEIIPQNTSEDKG